MSERWYLQERTGANYPWSPPWRGRDSKQGYPGRQEAENRAKKIRDYCAAKGKPSPDLTPIQHEGKTR